MTRSYLVRNIPQAITLTIERQYRKIGCIKLCYILKNPYKKEGYWSTKIVKRTKITYGDDYAMLCYALMQKYHVPFIPGIMKNDAVSIAHQNIIEIHKTFVLCNKDKSNE